MLLRVLSGELGDGKEDKKAERVGTTASGAVLGNSVFHNGNSTYCVSGIPFKQQPHDGLLYPSEK